MRNRTRLQSMAERHQYDQKAEKTKDGELISSYMCTPESAADEFEISKKLYYQLTGRSQPKKRDIIMYRIVQSFKPGEISPEQANEIGYELAMRFTGGKHQFVVCTHTDKKHIHNHIEFNSTNLDCDGKFQNVKDTAFILRQMNDELCREYGLSIIEQPQRTGKTPGEAMAIKHGASWKEQLRNVIDRVIPDADGYEDFLARMRHEGYEIKDGKNLSFRAPGQERFTRSHRLGDSYTKEALRDRSQRRRGSVGTTKKPFQRDGRKINLLVDIQKKMAQGKGPGYEHWAKIFNLKEAAKTLNYLVDHNLTDYDELTAKAERAGEDFDKSSQRIKQLEARMSEIAEMRTHIIQYSKTREVYSAYRKSRHKKEFLAEHRDEIAQHEAAKRAFDALNGKPIPKVADLSKQYAQLLSEKQEEYERYKAFRQEMITLQNAKQNVDRILRIDSPEHSEETKEKGR